MTFLGIVVEGSRDGGGEHVTYFAIPNGQESAAGRDLLHCLADGLEVSLCNDLDEGHEGLTVFRGLPSGVVTRIGGHGWQGEWKLTDEAAVLQAVTELANFNRGGHWANQGSITRRSASK